MSSPKTKRHNPQHPGRLLIPTPLPFDYELRAPTTDSPRELIILLHGYAESGKRVLSKLEPVLPKDAIVLAPNGPFPMAVKTDTGYKMVHAWYFYDPGTQEYFIDMQLALDVLTRAVTTLGYEELPKRLIGFSQGGYLAPFAAQKMNQVTQVIGLACEYLSEELVGELPFRVDGVHGAKDDVVKLNEARQSHAALAERGVRGELVVLPETTHRIDADMQRAVATLISAR